jgi:hypothetical protein
MFYLKPMPKINEKGFVHIFVFLLLVAGLVIGLYLINNKTNFTPKADQLIINIPGRVEVEDYDQGGEGIAYHDVDNGNNGGAYRSDSVDLQNTSDTGGGYIMGWVLASEWENYSVNVSTAGTYQLTARVASPGDGGNFHIEFNGANKTGSIHVPSTGGWDTWTDVTIPNITLSAGQQIMKVVWDSNGATGWIGNINWFDFKSTTSTTTNSTPAPTTAPYYCADVDGSGNVDISDWSVVRACFGQPVTYSYSAGKTCASADFNKDNTVDIVDWSLVSSQFGQKCKVTPNLLFDDFRKAFGSIKGDSNFDARFDSNSDGLIDIVDFSLLREAFTTEGILFTPPYTLAGLRATFGLRKDQTGFNAVYDLDPNGLIDIVDFSILRRDYIAK